MVQYLAALCVARRVVSSISTSDKHYVMNMFVFSLSECWLSTYICLYVNVFRYVCQSVVPTTQGILKWGQITVRDLFPIVFIIFRLQFFVMLKWTMAYVLFFSLMIYKIRFASRFLTNLNACKFIITPLIIIMSYYILHNKRKNF